MDYEFEEMTAEQREVFEAMQHEDEGYEELEDNFMVLATGGEDILKYEEDEDYTKILDEDINEVKGNLLSHEAFKKIIAEDRKLLQIELKNNKGDFEEEEITENKPKTQKKANEKNDKVEISENNELDMFASGPKRTNKNVVVEEEKVQVLSGGGKLIIRKVQKTGTKKASESYDQHDITEQANENSQEEKDDQLLQEEDDEDMPYEVDDQLSTPPDSENSKKDFSESEEEVPLTNDQLKQLYTDYKQNKTKEIDVNKPIKSKKTEKVVENEEVVEKTAYFYHDDLLAQAQECETGDTAYISDSEYIPLNEKPQVECQSAPLGYKKHTNFFCMEVVKDNDEVKPLPRKPKKVKEDKNQHKIDVKVPPRDKNETKEEKAQRKQNVKAIKEASVQRNREFKAKFQEMKTQYLHQQIRIKESDSLAGVSKFTVRTE